MVKNKPNQTQFNKFIETLAKKIYADFSPKSMNLSKCRNFILTTLHGAHPICVHCDMPLKNSSTIEKFFEGKQVKCGFCLKSLNGLSKTDLAYMKVNFDELYLLFFLTSLGVSKTEISKIMGRSPSTIRDWFYRFNKISEGECNGF